MPQCAKIYRETALAMLDALCDPQYLAIDTPGWEGILKHGVYHTQKNLGVDESVMWGEFFFVEAPHQSPAQTDSAAARPAAILPPRTSFIHPASRAPANASTCQLLAHQHCQHLRGAKNNSTLIGHCRLDLRTS